MKTRMGKRDVWACKSRPYNSSLVAAALVLLGLFMMIIAPEESVAAIQQGRFNLEEATSQLEKQFEQLIKLARGKRVGLITNPTGVDGRLRMIADRLREDPHTTVVAFFAPEHGLRGSAQAGQKITDQLDPATSIPVFSLYGPRPAPSAEALEGIDMLIFDIQDVGARFYTYGWTMTHAMEAAARKGIPFVVFDRPNPIGGHRVEGAPNTFDCGLIGRLSPTQPFGVATRHGLTLGELAAYVNGEWLGNKVELHVIKLHGWRRSMYFDETGRMWVPPSPNMPTLETALVYPGMCLFEGTNLSEGRGTTRPFETIGAPFVQPLQLVAALERKKLSGVLFRPTYFTPSFSKWQGQMCGGIQLHVTDRESFQPVHTGIVVLKTLLELYPGEVEVTPFASKLMGIPDFHKRILTESVESLEASWQENLQKYLKIREKYLLYEN
ncbi:MAG: DUF1343 domain-containing protein [Candidatus Sumerlaeaceae bacterium]|nr:DUF1343 domain-containing protein [Candidatus Sumerlaeaceae bacterium]